MEDLSISSDLARRWCAAKGNGWHVQGHLGKGGTAPVFEIASPDGVKALKIYDEEFSTGQKGEIEKKRIEQQLALKGHDCPYLVQVYEGGEFEGRLYLLMSRAPGEELEQQLSAIPRNRVRTIIDRVARAALFLKSRNLCHRDIKAANIFISDDFSHPTLLDISVIRDIYDPLGVGTDQGGMLPVLATARYSPPEYLFRLLDPGAQLWHALTIYQLGALLHDLIMRESLFQAEYDKSATNRYRFAWVIASTKPIIQANDVDQDLIFLAHRALDKDWIRRARLRIEDFLAEPSVEQSHALQLLGMSSDRFVSGSNTDIIARLKRIREVAKVLESGISEYLRTQNVKAVHSVKPGSSDSEKLINFQWKSSGMTLPISTHGIELQISLKLHSAIAGNDFKMSVALYSNRDQQAQKVSMELPAVKDIPDCEAQLVSHLIGSLANLALQLTKASG